MAAPKGTRPPAAGIGRKKGVPNKSTVRAKEAIGRFIDGNSKRLQGWLDKIAKEDGPRAAFDCYVSILEFHTPKIARVEQTGEHGGPIILQLTPTDAAL